MGINIACEEIDVLSKGQHGHPPYKSKSTENSLIIMNDQCRLCMAEENLCDIDSSMRDCLKNEYSIEIKDEDELSTQICQQCLVSVSEVIECRNKINKFGDKITKVQKRLKKILKKKYTNTTSDLIKDTSQKNKFKCRNCNQEFPSLLLLGDHPCIEIDVEAGAKIREILKNCDERNQVSTSCSSPIQSPSIETTLSKKRQKVVHRTQSEDILQENKYKCRNCNQEFPSLLLLGDHPCIEIDVEANEKIREKRQKVVHRTQSEDIQENKYQCKNCNQGFPTLLMLSDHPCIVIDAEADEEIQKTTENGDERNQSSYSLILESPSIETTSLKKLEKVVHQTQFEDVSQKNKFRCRNCNEGFPTLFLLGDHQCVKIDIEADEKIQKTLEIDDEENKASPSPIPSPSIETKDVVRKRKVDSPMISANKKIKTAQECTLQKSTFNCTICYEAFPSIMELDDHHKSCVTTLNRIIATGTQQKSAKKKVKKKRKKRRKKLNGLQLSNDQTRQKKLTELEPPIPSNSVFQKL